MRPHIVCVRVYLMDPPNRNLVLSWGEIWGGDNQESMAKADRHSAFSYHTLRGSSQQG